jgi:hypothetical protein
LVIWFWCKKRMRRGITQCHQMTMLSAVSNRLAFCSLAKWAFACFTRTQALQQKDHQNELYIHLFCLQPIYQDDLGSEAKSRKYEIDWQINHQYTSYPNNRSRLTF